MAGLADCNFVGKIPETHCYIQTVKVGEKSIQKLWLSLTTLSGWTEPAQYTGMFKGWVDGSGKLRSLPNRVPTASRTIKSFWDASQLNGEDFGLAGVHFRNMLLWYMMAAYGQRGCQECKLDDGTQVWGVGLDGTESANNFASQSGIKTGATLSLGTNDGKAEVLDQEGATAHSVKVLSYENPWGQYWEMDGHLCSIGDDVVAWRENFMPTSSAPTLADFAGVKTQMIARNPANISNSSSTGHKMNMLPKVEQDAYMIPYATQPGVSYGDYFYYSAAGQLWLWGGVSSHGASCGLAYSHSGTAWTSSHSIIGARLAFFGKAVEITGQQLIA